MSNLSTIENLVILLGFVSAFIGLLTVGAFVVEQVHAWLNKRGMK